MPEKRNTFLRLALALMFAAFVAAFFVSVANIGKSGVLFSFALRWELASAVGRFALWAPAVLLVAAALSAEGASVEGGFHGLAFAVLTPALLLAAALSLFYLLAVPAADARAEWYVRASADFDSSLARALQALEDNDPFEAERHVLRCKTIDRNEERYISLNDRIQEALIKFSSTEPAESVPVSTDSAGPAWKAANRFYLQAVIARDEGRYFDAHYLAKRSLALYPGRREVAKLVEETWRLMQTLKPSPGELASASFYARKVEGYRLFSEGDFLEAFRLYTELSTEDPNDPDVSTYLAKSAEGLDRVAYFIEEDHRAFSRSDTRTFRMNREMPDGKYTVEAAEAAVSPTGVYLRDLRYVASGMVLTASFGRLKGDNLYLRAVDRENPAIVWEPRNADSANAMAVVPAVVTAPFGEAEAIRYLELAAPVSGIPLGTLLGGMNDAARFGLDTDPLLRAIAIRLSFPFIVVMLVLTGAALGMRFRATQAPSLASNIFWAPTMAALILPLLGVGASLGQLATSVLVKALPRVAFLPAWLGFLSFCVVICLLVASRIARHTPH
ncbi:MAG: hypothetical protein E4H20_02655 [Spirochaetales bacterium]|nr:MAG: hypothetical protein E4H20_02655 [Spirochaetales bacterium]